MGTVPVIPTFTTNENLLSSDMNKIAAALQFLLYNKPLCKAHSTIIQTLTSQVTTVINLDTTDVDTDGGRNGVGSNTDRYVARTRGWYMVAATVGYAAPAAGSRFAIIMVNGVEQNGYSSAYTTGAVNAGINVSGLVRLNVGDYLQIAGFQDSGGSINTAVSPTYQAASLSVQFVLA